MPTANSSLSPVADDRLIRVPLDRLHAHPANANVMEPERLDKLARNIERGRRYPPLVVRPHPKFEEAYELLDGHQREAVLRLLGYPDALCYVWPCDDAEALLLLATLNRLEGADNPALRAQLLTDLTALLPEADLALLLPETPDQLADLVSLVELDLGGLMADLERAAAPRERESLRAFTVALDADGEAAVEAAIAHAITGFAGKNRRGHALAEICVRYLDQHGA